MQGVSKNEKMQESQLAIKAAQKRVTSEESQFDLSVSLLIVAASKS